MHLAVSNAAVAVDDAAFAYAILVTALFVYILGLFCSSA